MHQPKIFFTSSGLTAILPDFNVLDGTLLVVLFDAD